MGNEPTVVAAGSLSCALLALCPSSSFSSSSCLGPCSYLRDRATHRWVHDLKLVAGHPLRVLSGGVTSRLLLKETPRALSRLFKRCRDLLLRGGGSRQPAVPTT